MADIKIIDLTPDNIADYGVCGYKDVNKHVELRKKIDWYKQYYPKGLRIKAVISKKGGYQGMLEYIPGEYAHRPVDAKGYMFIHCIFVGFKKEFKGKGLATLLIKECIKEAQDKKMLGVATVSRNGSFMANKDFFIKNHFQVVDNVKPDFELLALKFDSKSKNPKFKANIEDNAKKYDTGLTIMRSAQCPYTEKNVNAIIESAKKMNIKTNLIELNNSKMVQNSPSVFGSFCLIYDGKVLSHHPISKGRFENIMKKN